MLPLKLPLPSLLFFSHLKVHIQSNAFQYIMLKFRRFAAILWGKPSSGHPESLILGGIFTNLASIGWKFLHLGGKNNTVTVSVCHCSVLCIFPSVNFRKIFLTPQSGLVIREPCSKLNFKGISIV